MQFYIVFKYSLILVLKSKVFIWLSSLFLFIIFFLNLIFGLYIKTSNVHTSNIFVLDYLNVILIFLFLSIVSILYSNELFYNQKRNGIKTIEVKNGLKIYQIFFSKLLSLILVIIGLSLISSTLIVIENLIIFNDNIQVTKIIFINLYLIFLVPLFIFSLNLLILSLNLHKINLIFSSFFLGLLSLFWLVNSAMYSYYDDAVDVAGTSNHVDSSNYNVYFNYYIQNFKKKYPQNNSVLTDLKEYSEDSQQMKNLITYDDLDKIKDSNLIDYYNSFANNRDFYRSGNLFYSIDLFNLFNQQFFENDDNVVLAKYDKGLIEKNTLFKELNNFDIDKTDVDLFEMDSEYIELKNNSKLLHEMKNYISQLEVHFKNNTNLNNYYNDLKKINNLIQEFFENGFYFSHDHLFLRNAMGSDIFSQYSDITDYFKEPIKSIKNYGDLRKKIFDLQKNSSASSLYKAILFYIVNNYDREGFTLSILPNDFIPNSFQMSNYYTSPFLWLEFLTKYGLVEKTFGNIVTIDTFSFILANNFVRVNYDLISPEDTSVKIYKINGYEYKGPNSLLLVSLIFIYISTLTGLAFLFYKLNFYK